MNQDQIKLQEEISAALSRTDPEGLIALGAPFDEYDYEAKLITEYVSLNGSISKEKFISIFEEAFSIIANISNYNKAYNEVIKTLKVRQ